MFFEYFDKISTDSGGTSFGKLGWQEVAVFTKVFLRGFYLFIN
jgi:hypothetical protein